MAAPSAQTLQRLADDTGHQPGTLEIEDRSIPKTPARSATYPFDESQARAMIESVAAYPLLTGLRGRPPQPRPPRGRPLPPLPLRRRQRRRHRDDLPLATGPVSREQVRSLGRAGRSAEADSRSSSRTACRAPPATGPGTCSPQASSSSGGQICRSAPLEVSATTNGAGVAATNRAILGIDRHRTPAIASPVAAYMRMTMTRAALSRVEFISCVR